MYLCYMITVWFLWNHIVTLPCDSFADGRDGVFVGPRGVPYAVTHDGRTIRYPDPDVKVNGVTGGTGRASGKSSNHGKTIGKWENHFLTRRKPIGKPWENGCLPSGND